FFDRYYALPKDRGAMAIAGVIGAAAGSALVNAFAPPLRRWLPSDLDQYDDFFRPTRATIEVDGKPLGFTSVMSMQIGAIDGVLHFQAMSMSPVGVVCNMPSIVLGTPILGRQVFDARARAVSIKTAEGDRFNPVIDGEQFYGLERIDLSLGPSLRIPLLPAA